MATPKIKYKPLGAGKWEEPVLRGYRFVCCDCALVHRMDFRLFNGEIQFRVFRYPRATTAQRKAYLAEATQVINALGKVNT